MNNGNFAYRIRRKRTGTVLEIAAFGWPLRGFAAADWPTSPGAMRGDAAQQPALLHFAPGRWLAPEPTPALRALFAATASGGGGTVIDVSGKWETLSIAGPGATRLLACALDIEAVLQGRDCAAVTLFDCPAIVARAADGFAVWVQASYAADFMATAAQSGATLARGPA